MAQAEGDVIRPSIRRSLVAGVIVASSMLILALIGGVILHIRFVDSSTALFAACGLAGFVILMIPLTAIQFTIMSTFEVSKAGISKKMGPVVRRWKWDDIVAVRRLGFYCSFTRGGVPGILGNAWSAATFAYIPAPELLDDPTLARLYAQVVEYATDAHPLAQKLKSNARVHRGGST